MSSKIRPVHLALTHVSFLLALVALILDFLKTCSACGDSLNIHTTIAASGAFSYALLLFLGWRGHARFFYSGLVLASGIHAGLIASMVAGSNFCPICAFAGGVSLLLLGQALSTRVFPLRVGALLFILAGSLAVSGYTELQNIESKRSKERMARLRKVEQPLLTAAEKIIAVTVYEREGCHHCRHFRETYLPKLQADFGKEIKITFIPAKLAPEIKLTPTVVIEGGPVFEGVRSYDDLYQAVALKLGRPADEIAKHARKTSKEKPQEIAMLLGHALSGKSGANAALGPVGAFPSAASRSTLGGGGWTRLVNTALQANYFTNSVCPANNPGGAYLPDANFHDGCFSKIDAWSGAAADTKRNRLIFPATGGHGPTGSLGNESYSLDLVTPSPTVATGCTFSPNGCRTNATAPTMTRLDNPSIYTEVPTGCTVGSQADGICRNADGMPWAGHTWGGTIYLPKADKVVRYNAMDPSKLWLWDATTQKWADSNHAGWPYGNAGAYCALDPTTANESLICATSEGSASVTTLVRYDAVTNVVNLLNDSYSPHWQDSPGVVVDPDHKRFYAFGNNYAGTPAVNAKLFMVDLQDPTYALQDVTASTSGCIDLLQNGYPGVQWDPTLHKIVGYVPRRQTTSSTAITLPASGTQTIAIPTGLAISSGSRVALDDVAFFGTNEIQATVTSYDSGTGLLVMSVSNSYQAGTPTVSNWIVAYQFNAIVTFDPGAMTCAVDPSSTGDPLTSPTPDWSMLIYGRGMMGRFNYFPSYPGGARYAVVSGYDQDAWTFEFSPSDATPPTAPTSLTATAVSSSQINLSWNASTDPDDASSTLTYQIFRGPTLVATTAAGVTTYSDSGLTASTAYSYTVIANDRAGNTSTQSSPATATTQPGGGGGGGIIGGLGGSTVTCIDRDGDGYGTGPGCLGPDADDLDATVHTEEQALAKWGSMTAFLAHLGYTPGNIWYISATGNDSTGVVNDIDHPFKNCCGTGQANPVAGDMIMFRGGDYSGTYFYPPSGVSGNPTIVISYPGEQAQFAGSGGIDLVRKSFITADGFKFVNTGGRTNISGDLSNNMTFRHIDSSENEWQLEAAQIHDFLIEDNVFHDNLDQGCGSAQHGIYLASHIASQPSYNIIVRRNLLYNNCYNGIQFNGKFTNVLMEQNIVYGNGVGGFAWLSGVKNSVMRDNVAFDNAQTGLSIFNYQDFCAAYDPTGIGTTCPYDQNGNLVENNTFYHTGIDPSTAEPSTGNAVVGVINSPGYVLSNSSFPISIGSKTFVLATWSAGSTYQSNDIVAYNGSFYVAINRSTGTQPGTNPIYWELIGDGAAFWANNNRIRVTSASNPNKLWMEGLVTSYSVGDSLTINVDSVLGSGTFSDWCVNLNRIGDLGKNTFRNNIMVGYSAGGPTGYPQFRYDENIYPATSTYQNNIFYSLQPEAGAYTNVIQTVFKGVNTYYTCPQAMAASGTVFGNFTNCINAEPQFVSASPSFWNSPNSFNFNLQSSSPAISAGSPLGAPIYDVLGNPFANPPSIGAYENSAMNGPPVIISTANANPNPANVNQSVAFGVAAADPDGDILTYTWDFGDNTTSTGASVTHIYSLAGTFTTTVTVSDGKGGSVQSSVAVTVNIAQPPMFTLTVSNGIGSGSYTSATVVTIVANAAAAGQVFDQWTGAAVADANSPTTTLIMPAADTFVRATYKNAYSQPLPLTLTKLNGKVFFNSKGHDSVIAAGSLAVPIGFKLAGTSITIDIGGATGSFTLNSKGTGKSRTSTFALHLRNGAATFTASLKNGSWTDVWSALGMINANVTNSSIIIPVSLSVNGTTYAGTRHDVYTARKDKGGAFK
jgi:chitodextrinase